MHATLCHWQRSIWLASHNGWSPSCERVSKGKQARPTALPQKTTRWGGTVMADRPGEEAHESAPDQENQLSVPQFRKRTLRDTNELVLLAFRFLQSRCASRRYYQWREQTPVLVTVIMTRFTIIVT